jgi:hypothetical protein
MTGSTPGRCTFTATSCPVSRSTALYTCRPPPKQAPRQALSGILGQGIAKEHCRNVMYPYNFTFPYNSTQERLQQKGPVTNFEGAK